MFKWPLRHIRGDLKSQRQAGVINCDAAGRKVGDTNMNNHMRELKHLKAFSSSYAHIKKMFG